MANLTNSAKLIEEMEKKVNSSSLATVATSGSYTDLINKPTIPTVNNSTIKIQKNSADVDSFTTNASSGKTINITMTKSDVGLGNVDNTSDASKPISNATQTALNAKADANSVYTKAEVDSAISSAVSSVYKYKGSKANYDSLPTTGNKTGDVWNVEAAHTTAPVFPAGSNVAWDGTAWDILGGTVDLSNYAQKSEVLTKTNTTSFTPTANYHPATKKYVDDTASGKVSDTAYASSWNGVTTVAPSKNAVYDKLASMDTTIGNKANDSDVLKKTSSSMQTCSVTGSGATTALALASNTDTSYIALNGSNGFLGSYGVTSDKKPTFYNGNSYQLAYTTDIPTVNNGTLTVTQNGTSKGTFTANQSGNSTIALTDTTYENKAAASGGTAVSLVTTGEKYTWNNKIDSSALPTAMTASELNTGTSTTGRTVSAALLKAGITGAINANIDTRDYSSSWDGSAKAPTQNAVYDKINAMDTTISGKQNTISDLATIRSNASTGATAYSGDSGTSYIFKVSNTAPAAGTASNIITFVIDS